MFEPAHIVIGPLTRDTLSLAGTLLIEIIRKKSDFDLLQLSVLSPHANDPGITRAATAAPPQMNDAPVQRDPATGRIIPPGGAPAGPAVGNDAAFRAPIASAMRARSVHEPALHAAGIASIAAPNPNATQTLSPPPDPLSRPHSPPMFDVVHATIAELRAVGIPVVETLEEIAPPDHIDPWVDRMTVPAPAAWFAHLSPSATLVESRQSLAAAIERGHVRKVCYLRPVECDFFAGSTSSSTSPLLDHEVVARYGVLAEDLPYLPLEAPSLACPVTAATSALFPEETASLQRRNSMRRLSATVSQRASRANSAAVSRVPSTSDGLFTGNVSLVEAAVRAVKSGSPSASAAASPVPQVPAMPERVVFPLPLVSVMQFVVSIVSSRFIYDQDYLLTGSRLELPAAASDPYEFLGLESIAATPPSSRLTPPPSPPLSDGASSGSGAASSYGGTTPSTGLLDRGVHTPTALLPAHHHHPHFQHHDEQHTGSSIVGLGLVSPAALPFSSGHGGAEPMDVDKQARAPLLPMGGSSHLAPVLEDSGTSMAALPFPPLLPSPLAFPAPPSAAAAFATASSSAHSLAPPPILTMASRSPSAQQLLFGPVTPVEDPWAVSTLEDVEDESLEEHLTMLHDHVQAAMGVQLSSLRTASGRTLGGIAMSYAAGKFAISSNDYRRVLHVAPPEFVVVPAIPFSDEDEDLIIQYADADHYNLAGGRFTVAVKVPLSLHDWA
ncbi:hypothetical protein BC828DRAFT_403777 [Blastocladiella britannica]|nr:hypothetical protein BC828DRAFT_403777 [Blastocladiella britannica]